jgi:hypothetical protein
MDSFNTLQYLRPLFPIDFFALSWTLPYYNAAKSLPKQALLPNFCELMSEKAFAEVRMAYNEEGIAVHVLLKKGVEEGDSVELFFDTRHVRTLSRFTHHFLIEPDRDENISCREVTRFRSEETRALCDPAEVSVEGKFLKQSYEMRIFLPSHVLHGYDPQLFNQMGFTYRISRHGKESQHFALSSKEYSLPRQVSLWATLKLGEKS